MNRISIAVCLLGLAAITPRASAQGAPAPAESAWTLRVNGQLRARLNAEQGRDLTAGRNDRTYVTQRARVGASAAHVSGTELFVQLEDLRWWGEEANTQGSFSANNLDVHQAWAQARLLPGLTARFGRQELSLDNQRLVGNLDWVEHGRSFDAIKLALTLGGAEATAFYAKVNQRWADADGLAATPVQAAEVDLGGAHVARAFGANKVAALYLVNARHAAADFRHTAGLTLFGAAGPASYSAEGYYQFGHLGAERVSAWLAAVRGGWTFPVAFKPSVSAFAEAVSGDGTPQGTFDTLYATNHKFYGELDLFLALPGHTANLGLVDVGGQVAVTPLPWLKASVDYHTFRAVEADAAGEQRFGSELDLKVAFTRVERLSVALLYGVFFPGEAIRTPRRLAADADLATEHGVFVTFDVQL